MSATVFWPYFTGIVTLAVGLITTLREKDKASPLGRSAFAVPMAIFGGEHFIAAKAIAGMIPGWIPGHLFWAYLVGVALVAAALSIAANKFRGLAGTLLGVMIFCFVLLIHVPRLAAHPSDRFAMAVLLRDLAFSAGAFVLGSRLQTAARFVVAVAMLFFGVQHFLHADFVPVVPLELAMPNWVPIHRVCSYLVGLALVGGGACLFANWHARRAAMWLGIIVFVVVLLIYVPILARNPSDIFVGMNYFADTLLVGGTLLVLADSTKLRA